MSRRELHPLVCCLACGLLAVPSGAVLFDLWFGGCPPSGRSLRDRPPSPASGEGKPPSPASGEGKNCLVAGGVRPATRTLWFQIFSATRRRADRARGLAATSSSEGRTGCRVMTRRVARWPQVQTGCWGG